MMKHNHWKIPLFFLPYGSPQVISLGPVSSSFLQKRRQQSRIGCYVALDNQPRDMPDRKEKNVVQPEEKKTVTSCQYTGRLRRKAKSVVRFIETDRGLKRAHALPSLIQCGSFRSAVRCCFSSHLELADELSLKTAAKIERRYCEPCSESFVTRIDKWKEERFCDIDVDDAHVSQFRDALARNVDDNWNLGGSWPYVPNGHGTAYNARMEGGNWNEEPFVGAAAVSMAVSSGKPRIVTSYSSRYTEVLYPLHRSLYACLKRKGWLLIGEPTPEKVASLNGKGEYISVDYESATDNIKTVYSVAAVEVLIRKASGLTDQELQALRWFGRMSIDGKLCDRGQPMGSMMSFPLLCLINKTCVDMALNDLLTDGEISFNEWTSHRCLINGDDLLLKSPTHQGALTYLPRLCWHGGQVGLKVNKEKTMVDGTGLAEINSTLFKDGRLEKKTNAGIFRGGEVSDVIGYADRSCCSTAGFIEAVLALVPHLRVQSIKTPVRPLSNQRWRALLQAAREHPRLKDALTTVVREEPLGNAFPVVEEPLGYSLSAEEEKVCIEQRVRDLRSRGYKGEGACGSFSNFFFGGKTYREPCRKIVEGNTSLRKALSRKTPVVKTRILKVLADCWKNNEMRRLVDEDDASVDALPAEHVCDECAEMPLIFRLSCELKAFNKRKRERVLTGLVPDLRALEHFGSVA